MICRLLVKAASSISHTLIVQQLNTAFLTSGVTPIAEAATLLAHHAASIAGQQSLYSPQVAITPEAGSNPQAAGSPQAAIDVAVQTDLHLMHLPTPDAISATAADEAEAPTSNSPALKGRQQQLALPVLDKGPQPLAGSRHDTTDASCGPESCDSPRNHVAAADASCGTESRDSPCHRAAAADAADSSTASEHEQAHSMHSSSGHRLSSQSSSQQAARNNRPETANNYSDTIQACSNRGPEVLHGDSREGSAGGANGQKTGGGANGQSGQRADGQLLERRAKVKGEAQWSRGLQLPQKLSIATLAKHAGVDRVFMQVSSSHECVSSYEPLLQLWAYVRVTSNQALAGSCRSMQGGLC